MPRGVRKTAYEAAEILGVSLAEIYEADGIATASDSKVSMTRVRENLKKISDNELLKIQLGAEFFQGEPTPASEDWHSAKKAEAEPKPEAKPKPKAKPKAKPRAKPKPEPEPIDALLEQMAQLGF